MKSKWIIRWRGMEIPIATIVAFAVCAFWSLGMVLAPLSLPPDSVTDLSGTVGTMENTDITEDMNPYAKFFYEAGDSQCHTIKERSLFVNGNQMPFCARDVGIFFGMTLGLLITMFIRLDLKWWWLVGGLVPIGIDGTVQLVTSYESNNFLRITTGGLAGLVTTLALGWVLFDISQVAEMRHEEPLEGDMYERPMEDFSDQKDEFSREREGELALEPKESRSAGEVPSDAAEIKEKDGHKAEKENT